MPADGASAASTPTDHVRGYAVTGLEGLGIMPLGYRRDGEGAIEMTQVVDRGRTLRPSRLRHRLLAGALGLVACVAVPAAGASTAVAKTGRATVYYEAEFLKGIAVTLPTDSKLRTLKPGDVLRVGATRLDAAVRNHRVAVVTLSRLGARPAVIARGTVDTRSKDFSLQIPPTRSSRYRLRWSVGRSFTEVTFGVTFSPSLPPGPCAEPLDVSAELGVESSEPEAGETIGVTLTDSGPGCLQTGYGFAWQVNRNGAWVDVPLNTVVPAIALFVQPGRSLTENFTVPKNSAPGPYRIVKRFTAAGESVDVDGEVTVVRG